MASDDPRRGTGQVYDSAVSRSHSAAPPVPATDLHEALAVLRGSGLRVSAARRIVLEAMFQAGEPLTAERIASGLDGRLPSSDVASVYRNLETLEEVGLVRHVHLGHGPGLYALTRDGAREHLLCDRCGTVMSVDPSRLDAVRDLIRAETGFAANFTHFPIAGLCPECADARP
jgi:Fur family transcriptional regulator, ferric uptake regulator